MNKNPDFNGNSSAPQSTSDTSDLLAGNLPENGSSVQHSAAADTKNEPTLFDEATPVDNLFSQQGRHGSPENQMLDLFNDAPGNNNSINTVYPNRQPLQKPQEVQYNTQQAPPKQTPPQNNGNMQSNVPNPAVLQYAKPQKKPIENSTIVIVSLLSISALILAGVIAAVLLLPSFFSRNGQATPSSSYIASSNSLTSDPASSSSVYSSSSEINSDTTSSQENIALLDIADSVSSAELQAYAENFYISYLKCINNLDIEYLAGATDAVKNEVETRFDVGGNQKYLFYFVSCELVPNTRSNRLVYDVPTIEVKVQFQYTYTARKGSSSHQNGSNVQLLQFIYVNETWLVNKFERQQDTK